jgi:hypothetical protein
MSIIWRELYAIVKAISTWGNELANKRILMYCDNMAVVYIVNSGTSRDAHIMKLVRHNITLQYELFISMAFTTY